MLKIRRAVKADYSALCSLSVTVSQSDFVLPIADTWAGKQEHEDFHVICQEGADGVCQIIGFFLIDRSFASHQRFNCFGELGLRAFFIDQQYQGKGYGRQACLILGDYVAESYPESSGLVLTVNLRNKAARALYLACGFIDTQQLYLGGPAGPQHIMYLGLKKAESTSFTL